MIRTKKNLFMILICMLLLGIVVIYSYNASRSETLEIGVFVGSNWNVANANSYTIMDKAIEHFESQNPDIKVHYYSGIPKEDYSEWLTGKMMIGKMPDVFMVLEDDFNKLASMGELKDLSTLMSRDTGFSKSAYYQTVLDTGTYYGKQYALPYEAVPNLMFVNKTLLQKEGITVPDNDWTWDDLYSICTKVTKDTNHDGILDQYGLYNYHWTEAVYANGASLFDKDGRQSFFTDERVEEAIKFVMKIEGVNKGNKVTQEDFDNGNVAFMPLPFSEYRTYKTYPYRIKKYTNFQWDCITLPSGSEGNNTSEINTLLIGISANTKKEAAAWAFLKTLTFDQDIQMDVFRYSQGASVLKSVTQSKEAEEILQQDMEESEKVIDMILLNRVLEEGIIVPKFQNYTEAMAVAENDINQMIEGEKSIESSLKILQRSMKRYLAQ
ncbi:MAG: sugar ABC transporter substrate-binding protein [Lachnospiraceae bacterium]|nr:sugar ABC transporter substrate-binding protein [Lachnospiraceae bacterium]MDD3661405.1 sugar ABC transporter substrate-binding protein [Lachnospiraceae bacterium]